MIHAMYSRRFEVIERPPGQTAAGSANFATLVKDASSTPFQTTAQPNTPADSGSDVVSTGSASEAKLGDPDVQGWLDTYFGEGVNISYQPAAGAGNNYPAGTVYSPQAIYTQAMDNIIGNSFASLTGDNPAGLTSQLPGIPSPDVQQEFDRRLANENAERLSTGQPIDTTAYWADPGSITMGGQTYSSQELGYAGPGQSSGPQPIFISEANRIQGTDTFSVGGYTGTVAGIQPGRYYTLQQLEQAGLKSGQPDGQFHPGSWTLTQSA